MKEILGVLSVVFEIVSITFYYRAIFRGETKPHLYTHLVWVTAASVIFAGQFVSGAGAGAWATAASALATFGIVILSFKFGTKDVTRSDGLALFFALFTIIPWILTKNPLWSVLLASMIDGWAMFPTFRKTWNDPYSESMPSWLFSQGRVICSFAALSTYSLTTWFYPVEVFFLDSVLIGLIVFRRRNRKAL